MTNEEQLEELERVNENLENLNENIKHLVRAVDDVASVLMTKPGKSPESNYRV